VRQTEEYARVRDEEFERLYSEHADALLGFLTYRTGDRVLAEDLLADTFERVLRKRFRFDRRKASEKTWIYTIALNCLRDDLRRRAAGARALERSAAAVVPATGQMERAEVRQTIAEALECLTDEEREVIALRFGADLTVPEIAQLTGLRLSTVKGRVYRALEKMREVLDE
jgi:RNA polymerase sigma-70 factor (ECF subfamily)